MRHFVLVEFKCNSRQNVCALEQQARCCTMLTAGGPTH